MGNLAGLNGLERNLKKLKQEYQFLREQKDGKVTDWLKQPWNVHHYVDMFVESERASPYLMGHFWSIYFPLSIALIILL